MERPRGTTLDSIPPVGRSLLLYEKFLNFKRTELEGKRVLDLGSGLHENFANGLKESEVKAKVVSLNPDLAEGQIRNQRIETGNNSVAALGEQLPFLEGSFDYVLALESLTRHSKNIELWLLEVYRVLDKGGIAKIGPVDKEYLKKFDQIAKTNHINYEVVESNINNTGNNLLYLIEIVKS